MTQPAVFMDRDGTLIEDTGYVRRPEDVRLLPGADFAVRRLNDAGFKTVLVTNQSGVARGLMTPADVEAVNARLVELLADVGAHLDGIYFCPHLPDGNLPQYARDCDCRKPKPGLLLQAAQEMDLDLSASYMVGDSPRDVEAGRAAGCRTILIDRGVPLGNVNWDIVPDMDEAARRILADSGRDLPPVKPAEAEFTPEPEEPSPLPTTPAVQPIEPEEPVEPGLDVEDSPAIDQHELDFDTEDTPAVEPPSPTQASPQVIPIRNFEPDLAPTSPAPAAPEPVVIPLQTTKNDPVDLVDCAQCGAMIPDGDLTTGRAREVAGRILCRDCFIYHQARTTQARPVSNADLLAELKNISRSLVFEKFSVFNIFGGLAQALVFAAMLYAGLSGNTQTGLLWAIALQLLALTFFILGRQ